jgi:glycolate oxidase FAD binding subunit
MLVDNLEALTEQVAATSKGGRSLTIVGGGTKTFLGNPPVESAMEISVRSHCGIVDYHPEELVIRARAGTPIAELKQVLDKEGQILAFDPPDHSGSATLGGVVATGLSGSRRPYSGAVKDFVLGVGMILHDGAYCEFGGQVMKNVAGYDVSRLVCGSFGTLGILADVSLKVLPKPETEITLVFEVSLTQAKQQLEALTRQVSPLSASCFVDGSLRIRLSGGQASVLSSRSALGGEETSSDYWNLLDTHRIEPFLGSDEVWRLSTFSEEPFDDDEFALCDWAFAQRWLINPASNPRVGYQGAGHWTRFKSGNQNIDGEVFEPLSSVELALHKRIKKVFDPNGLFNPQRLYRDL